MEKTLMLKSLIKEIILQEIKEVSAGILLWRKNKKNEVEVLLALPGGPFYVGKDAGSWGIPKGKLEPGENPMTAAVREFAEETGHTPKGKAIKLPSATLKSGKVVHAWAVKGDMDPSSFSSNTFELEWPLKSGKIQSFPEIARVEWFSIEDAKTKMVGAQQIFVDALISLIK